MQGSSPKFPCNDKSYHLLSTYTKKCGKHSLLLFLLILLLILRDKQFYFYFIDDETQAMRA